mmetsp:Transcript_8674/g.14974  ORF Transcript_8674/g.14974 Transcript_8674/m.14974 type:complete len:104 (+) Transcript_8674:724-1035(+)
MCTRLRSLRLTSRRQHGMSRRPEVQRPRTQQSSSVLRSATGPAPSAVLYMQPAMHCSSWPSSVAGSAMFDKTPRVIAPRIPQTIIATPGHSIKEHDGNLVSRR